MSSHQYVLEAINLVKKYKTGVAVNGISFGVKKGEILGFLGPNGAGKTTTIQMLLGILTKTSGDIFYFDKNFDTHAEEILERVNFSSTYTNLPWRLPVGEILKYHSYLYDMDSRASRVEEIVEIFRLSGILKKEIAELSAGQRTRVNLAKAFLNNPEILLLDEPTASLDPETAAYIREFLQEKQKKNAISILFTSHNMSEIEEICDRVIIIKNGEIVAEDTPANLPKKIQNTTLELVMVDGLKRTQEFCEKNSIIYSVSKRAITMKINEQRISWLLSELAKKHIDYDQISVNKPDLEDFFLEIARQKNENA